MNTARLRERRRTATKTAFPNKLDMSEASDSEVDVYVAPSQRRRSSAEDRSRPRRAGNGKNSPGSGYTENGEQTSRDVIDMLDLEGQQVVFMQPRMTELRIKDEEEGDVDGDSGISCEDHLLKESESLGAGGPRGPQKEKLRDILIQVFIPFMIAGLGMMAAGLLLDAVQVCVWEHWEDT